MNTFIGLSVCVSFPLHRLSSSPQPARISLHRFFGFLLEKRLQEVQRLHFEEQINELRTRLIESEEKNQYLLRQIDQLNQSASQQASSLDAGPVLLPDPK